MSDDYEMFGGTAMDPIFSMTSLQRNLSEVKAAARDSVVRITEQGAGSPTSMRGDASRPLTRRLSAPAL